MRQRAEDELALPQIRVLGCDELQIATGDAHGGAPLVVRRGERQLQIRVAPNESTELSARVPAGAENSNWNLVHR